MREHHHYCIKNSLLGNYYPMFLNNSNLGSSVYLYQLSTPGLSDKCVPLVSLEKVGEIVKHNDHFSATNYDMMGIDILSVLLNYSDENIESRGVDYLKSLLKREDPIVKGRGSNSFPTIEMGYDNNIQVSLIVNLRDELRWKCYRFYPERVIDILWSKDTFAVFKIEGNDDTISLTPVALYKNTDVTMKNPIPCDFKDYTKLSFSGKTKTSDMNRAIKRLEWLSFDK